MHQSVKEEKFRLLLRIKTLPFMDGRIKNANLHKRGAIDAIHRKAANDRI